jgi:L-threonylcarbamoyladenylate synthase
VIPGNEGPDAARRSPGRLARHYAPRTPLRHDAAEVRPGEALLAFGPRLPEGAEGAIKVLNLSERGDVIEAAANLFAMLHALDAAGARAIACAPVPMDGLGAAINDRLTRAAEPAAAAP